MNIKNLLLMFNILNVKNLNFSTNLNLYKNKNVYDIKNTCITQKITFIDIIIITLFVPIFNDFTLFTV